jgi:hypothetical protein
MGGFHDLYALAPQRTADAVAVFLAQFVPQRVESADEYEVPQFADEPKLRCNSADELIAYCVEHEHEQHVIYWRSLGSGDPFHAIVAFTSDGGLIFGLSVVNDTDHWLEALSTAVGSSVCIRLEEQPPPISTAEFWEFWKRSNG